MHPPAAAARAQLAELRSTLESTVKGMSEMADWTEEIKYNLEQGRRQFSPLDKLSEQPAAAIGARRGGRARWLPPAAGRRLPCTPPGKPPGMPLRPAAADQALPPPAIPPAAPQCG